MSHALLNEWKTTSALLRIVGGSKGMAFDTLCRIGKLSEDKVLLVWPDGDSIVSLEGAIFDYHELAEAAPEYRLPEEDEWTRQLIIRWPAEPEKRVILFEQRNPS